jgi:hypothetical protein
MDLRDVQPHADVLEHGGGGTRNCLANRVVASVDVGELQGLVILDPDPVRAGCPTRRLEALLGCSGLKVVTLAKLSW